MATTLQAAIAGGLLTQEDIDNVKQALGAE